MKELIWLSKLTALMEAAEQRRISRGVMPFSILFPGMPDNEDVVNELKKSCGVIQ